MPVDSSLLADSVAIENGATAR